MGQIGLSKQCRPRSDCSSWSSLIRVFSVCYSVCIFWTQYCTVKSICSNCGTIMVFNSGVPIFRIFTVYSPVYHQSSPGWLVGCFEFNGPLRQYFSLYRAVSQREGERGERIDESKNVQTTPTRTYCKRNRPLPYCYQNCRTPRHWKFTQHHRTTRPPPPPQYLVEKTLILSHF